MTLTRTQLDDATVDLIFALRDSLTDDGPSFMDFWSGGRCITALETAAAGAEDAHQAVTIAARKLQIQQYRSSVTKKVTKACELIDQDYPAWAAHIAKNSQYILALADVIRQERKADKKRAASETTRKPAATETKALFTTTATKEVPF